MSTKITDIVSALKKSEKIAIVIHQNPDGDAIGSAVALFEGLKELGKKSEIICTQDFPEIFEKLTGKINVNNSLPKNGELIILLDCCDIHRTGFSKQLKDYKGKIVSVDHHANGDIRKLPGLHLRNESASATSEIIFELLAELRVNITTKIATAVLLGVYTDTGGFLHNNTTSETLSLASRLIRYGADISKIGTTFTRTMPAYQKKIWGKILSEIKINKLGVVIAVISQDILKENGAKSEDFAGLGNYLALTNEARASLVMVETEQGWRGTLRTRHSTVDIGFLAKILGGKGHKKAAGFSTTKDSFSGKISK